MDPAVVPLPGTGSAGPPVARPTAAATALVVLAAGEGRRVGSPTNKAVLPLAGRPVLAWSLRRAAALAGLVRVVVVVRPAEADLVGDIVGGSGLAPDLVTLVPGGSTRHGSESRAFAALRPDVEAGAVEVVLVHDAARPLAPTSLYAAVAAAADEHGGALPVVDHPGLLPRAAAEAPVTERTVAVQTPQGFRARPLLAAYAEADRDGFLGTDTASCVERYAGLSVRCVSGDATNLKITFPEDVAVAERLLRRSRPLASG